MGLEAPHCYSVSEETSREGQVASFVGQKQKEVGTQSVSTCNGRKSVNSLKQIINGDCPRNKSLLFN